MNSKFSQVELHFKVKMLNLDDFFRVFTYWGLFVLD
jgi:hypothetical protein